jgi:hypothetical protein
MVSDGSNCHVTTDPTHNARFPLKAKPCRMDFLVSRGNPLMDHQRS